MSDVRLRAPDRNSRREAAGEARPPRPPAEPNDRAGRQVLSMIIRGALDEVSSRHVAGWAFCPDIESRLVVQARLGTEVIGEAVADGYRADLFELRMGDGKCAFKIQFRRELAPAYLPFVTVRPEGCDLELPRWHPLGLVEYFGAVFRGRPAAGRHRSIFGGLWIGRVDAAAVLRGKLEIGQIAREDAPAVAGLVQDGVAVVEGQPGLPEAGAVDAALLGRLFGADLARLLQGVLEDRLVVLGAEIVAASLPVRQASTESGMAGQNEVLALVAPLGRAAVQVDVVRGSHAAPEFTADGRSRWVDAGAVGAGLEALAGHGLLDGYAVTPGSVAIVAPGTLYALRCQDGAALHLVVVPARGVPASAMQSGRAPQTLAPNGVQIWL